MEFFAGNIWEFGADAICVTTNGIRKQNGEAVMGRGIARQAAELYPPLPRYLGNCLQKHGNRVFHFPLRAPAALEHLAKEPVIITFPTKHHWRDPSDIQLIKKSAEQLVQLVDTLRPFVRRVALPFPGCSNGGLRIVDVVPILKAVFGGDIRFFIVDYKVKDYFASLR